MLATEHWSYARGVGPLNLSHDTPDPHLSILHFPYLKPLLMNLVVFNEMVQHMKKNFHQKEKLKHKGDLNACTMGVL